MNTFNSGTRYLTDEQIETAKARYAEIKAMPLATEKWPGEMEHLRQRSLLLYEFRTTIIKFQDEYCERLSRFAVDDRALYSCSMEEFIDTYAFSNGQKIEKRPS